MPIGIHTPRDKFDQLIAFVRRTLRYWWLVGIISFVGGVLAVAFALTQKPRFTSQAKVFYNERIQSSILQGRDLGTNTRNLAYRYKEMLFSRTNMSRVIEEMDLFPKIRAKKGDDAALEEFQKLSNFRVRGTGMFLISFSSPDPEKAQAVTSLMVDILIEEDERFRHDQASATMNFLIKEKEKISAELDKRQRELARFLNEHPEFALETSSSGKSAPGVVIRAQAKSDSRGGPSSASPGSGADPRLLALERQRRRLKDRLEAPDDAKATLPKTPEQIEAERRVDEAERELRRAQRDLEDRTSRLTDAHPDVIRAQREVSDARRRLERARAQVPPAPPPPKPIDRATLRDDLREIEREIAAMRSKIRREKADGGEPEEESEVSPEEGEENWVVALETKYARLAQAVEEQNNRLETTDNRLSRAELASSQQMAEQGEVLTIIDPANLPTLPEGKGRGLLAAAGTAVFIVLGTLLALALALVDDRIYGGGDLERLAIAPVAVVVPKYRPPRAKRAKQRADQPQPRKQHPSG